MTSKEALRKLILDDFTPINDLVYRKGNNVQIAEPMYLGASPEDCYNIIEKDLDKLGQLEDIDDEIGIDYITLNRLRKTDTIYVKFNNEIQEWPQTKLDMRNCKIWYGYISGKGYTLSQPLSNYGKCFAITKEEIKYV